MAKETIRPIRTETEYDEALEEIERYFENEQKRGSPEPYLRSSAVWHIMP